MKCAYCGDTFKTERVTARYCPDKDCKKKAEKERNARPSKDSNKTNGGKVCAYCGKTLKSNNPRARYCPGGACKQAAWRKRKERATT